MVSILLIIPVRFFSFGGVNFSTYLSDHVSSAVESMVNIIGLAPMGRGQRYPPLILMHIPHQEDYKNIYGTQQKKAEA
jgi:hypothetical protein